jgi:hypothetical protein
VNRLLHKRIRCAKQVAKVKGGALSPDLKVASAPSAAGRWLTS